MSDEIFKRITELTEARFGKQWRENWAANWRCVEKLPGIISWVNNFGGAPCVISAAGPSLEKAFKPMRGCKGRYIHIGVDACYKRLRNAGLAPDITVTADSQESVMWIVGKRRLGDLFAGIPWQHPEYVQKIVKERDFVPYTEYADTNIGNYKFWGEIISKYFNGDSEYFGTIFPGSGVTSAALDIAYSMGCSPIIFVGLDLSWKVDNNDIGNISERADVVKDVHGDDVYTNGAYMMQKMYFEYMIPKMSKRSRIINATGGGLLGSGCELSNPFDALKLCNSKLWFNTTLKLRALLEHRKKTWAVTK